MVSPRGTESIRRWLGYLRTLGEGVGAIVIGAIVFGLAVFVFDVIYYSIAGKSADWLPVVQLAAYFGAVLGPLAWFRERILGEPAEGESRFISYLREAIAGFAGGFFVAGLLATLVALGAGPVVAFAAWLEAFKNGVNLLGAFELAFVLGAGLAFFIICNHAYERREFFPLAVTGIVIEGVAIGACLQLAVESWLEWQYGTNHSWEIYLSWHSIPTVWVGGAILVVAFELWRKFAKPRGWTVMVTVGSAIGLMANIANRGKMFVVGLWWTAVGGFVLWGSWSYVHSLKSGQTTEYWIGIFVGGAVGAYFIFARGLGPAWNAISPTAKLTEDDFVHGRGRLAPEDEAARAARGGRR
jgi:hypothetical protein